MCKILKEYEDIARSEGREEGRAEGRAEGRIEGMAKGREEGMAQGREDNLLSNLRNLMKNMRLTAEQAMDALSVPEENRPKYLAVLTAQA